jgi:uncharacterized membrane protein
MKTAVAFVHILVATVWLGGSFFYTVLLLPRLAALEPGARRALTRSLRAVVTPLLALSAAATIVSGLVMMVQLHALHPGSFSHTRWGQALIAGTLASVAALVVAGLAESRARRLADEPAPAGGSSANAAADAAGAADAGREGALRVAGLVLLVVALATMALARYS